MILARIIFIVGIGYLEGAQEVPDLSLAVALTGNGLEWAGGPKRTQKPHQNYFYSKPYMGSNFCSAVQPFQCHPNPNLFRTDIFVSKKWKYFNCSYHTEVIMGPMSQSKLYLTHS